ncbi:kinase-like domain-containing protein [Cokeromyces recurvatus]|uniref:kinase-like domain-containing protein n=1 Tax=Cokeromyces recurvatus TaxID=90255 RepID=UPI00221EF298|nr:kinase-like domain-containing protein [Cokeromyces recurvatus]KAI7902163.1 kinase-like domain-containing protein [Cokeromyces recurvatus]
MSNEDSESDYSDIESIHSDDEEDVEDYRKGGYHPVSIGDRFDDGRYIVVRKLGWGHFSTVWLALDTLTNNHVALKIVKSANRYTESALEEIKLLECVKKTNSESKGYRHVAQLLTHFWHYGPYGKHACMTFEVLGESLLSLMKRYNYKGIPSHIVKRISKQVLEGLDYLHRECGIVHTDLKPENVLVWIPNIEEYLKSETAETLKISPSAQNQPWLTNAEANGLTKSQKKRLKKKKAKTLANTQKIMLEEKKNSMEEIENKLGNLKILTKQPIGPKVIPSSTLDITSILTEKENAFDNIIVKIADLGNACWIDGEYTHFLFDPRAGSKYNKDDDHLAQMLELMRTVPKIITSGGELSREFFDRSGKLRHIKRLRYRRLRDVLHDTFLMPPEEADAVSAFLLPMLELDMAKRASASQMLKSPWLSEAV